MPRSGSSQTISGDCTAWQAAGGSTLSATRVVVLVGSVHSAVPPTAVTSGSDAGHPTVWPGMVEPPWLTGALRSLTGPLSPEEARTVTLLVTAALNASRRFSSECELPNASSAEPKLCEITSARWCSTTYFSAAIICGKPWTPSVSAVGVVTSRMLAPGATACAHSTSRATSVAQALRSSWPGLWFLEGGALVAGEPCSDSVENFAMPGVQATPGSPQRCGRPNASLKT